MLDTNWLKLYEAAMLEMNPDKLATCIGAAEQAIAQPLSILQNQSVANWRMPVQCSRL